MSCRVLTQSRLDALLNGRLETPALTELRTHFEAPCEHCLERLSGVEAERLLLALAPAAALTAQEQQRVFEGALAAAPRAIVEVKPSSRGWLRWLALAAVGAAAAAVLLVPSPPPAYDGIKGSGGPLTLQLKAFAALPGGQARAVDTSVRAGEAVFFRVALEQPAHFYLYAAGTALQVLWKPDPGEPAWPAGERELAEGGQALGFDPAALGPEVTVVAIAAPEPLAPLDAVDPAAALKACPRCAVQRLTLKVQ